MNTIYTKCTDRKYIVNDALTKNENSDNGPLITIIMPVRNNEKYFPIAVQTILDQDFTDWELIVLEGDSTDKTAEIAEDLASKDDRISVIHSGEWIYEKVNIGIYKARGKYFMVVNSDDKLAPNALSLLSEYLIKYDLDMFLIATGSIVCDSEQNALSNDFEKVESILPEELLILNTEELMDNWVRILASGLLNNQINVYKIGRIREFRFRNDVFGADYLYNLSVLPCIRSVAYIPKCLYYFHIYTDTNGLNTSVGKFYDYTHTMFNDFYFKGLNMFANNNRLDTNALLYLKKRRYMEFINSELIMYKFKTCGLSLDDILVRVFADASDIKELIDDDSITVDLDDKVLSFCNEMIGMHPDEKTNKMNSVAAGITELFLIVEKELTGINTESIKLMVYDYHNPSHLGEQLYNSLIEALDGVTS